MNQMRLKFTALIAGVVLVAGMASVLAFDLTKEKVIYCVFGAHLDTQWQWTLDETTTQHIPSTLHGNFACLAANPDYKFFFEGAYRYWIAKKNGGAVPGKGYQANDWTTLKNWVTQGRWIVGGGTWNLHDVNIPSVESLIRQTLYNDMFFMAEFGKRSSDLYLPDCFGFGYALPTVLSHLGLKGFSSYKFAGWGGWTNAPFDLGRWIGPDGSSIVACLTPTNYWSPLDLGDDQARGDRLRVATKSFTNGPGGQPGIWAVMDYAGGGDADKGGPPRTDWLADAMTRIKANGSNEVKVYCTGSNQIFDDLTEPMVNALPSWEGELVMRQHGVGAYSTWAPMKLKNRRNEQRAYLSEFSCVAANSITGGAFAYPADTIRYGWFLTLALQMHDIITGTSIPAVYRQYALPQEDSAYNAFNYALNLSTNSIANSASQRLTTTVSAADGRVPIVLVNSLAAARTDGVTATVNFGSAAPTGVKVYTPAGTEVPSQIISTSGQNATVLFTATVPAASYSVYEVLPTTAANPVDPGLTVDATTRTIENAYYKVTVNAAGDISSVIAKQVKGGQELLSGPSRLELRPDNGTMFAQWELQYADCSANPTYVSGVPTITVAERGPARVALKVARAQGSSQFVQYIRLAAGEAGKQVEVYNEFNWNTTGTLLKAGFPVTCANPNATWDLGVGTIQRPNMTSNRYEVPGQQWADMTSTDGSYGVSILNDCKHGWNKESNNKINLTLIHSPTPGQFVGDADQSSVDIIGVHKFTYWLYGHSGSWTNGTVPAARRMNQPVYSFQTTPRPGVLSSRVFSFVAADTDQVDVVSIKRAERTPSYIIRVRETKGAAIPNAHLTFTQNILSVSEMTGREDTVTTSSPASASGNVLTFGLTKYKMRAFAVTLGAVSTAPGRGGAMVPLPSYLPLRVSLAGARRTMAEFNLPANETIRSISIIDAKGRLVRNLAGRVNVAGAKRIVWDGCDTRGSSVPNGVYVVNVATGSGGKCATIQVVR